MKKIITILLLLAFSLPAYAITSEKANGNFFNSQEKVTFISNSIVTGEYAQIIIAPPPPPKREPAPISRQPKKKKKKSPPPAPEPTPEPAPHHPPR